MKPPPRKQGHIFWRNLKKSVELAEKYGVILAFETMETPFLNNCKKAMRYVLEVNSPYLKVYPDIGNCTNAALTYDDGRDRGFPLR